MKKIFFFFLSIFVFLLSFFCQEENKHFERKFIEAKEEIRISEEGDLNSPLISPSQKYLAFSKDNFKGIFLLNLENGKVKQITDLDGSGFGFEWQGYEDLLAFRGSLGNLRRKHVICVAHPDGQVEVSSPLLNSVSLPVWISKNLAFAVWGEKEKIKIVGGEKETIDSLKIVLTSPEGRIIKFRGKELEKMKGNKKVFFLPRYSKDGTKFLVHSLDGGIYLGSVDEEGLIKIAEGSNARFAKEDSAVIFDMTKDDGHRILESDIYLYDIKSKTTYQLTDTKEIIERMPSMAKDGCTLFWCENGKIMRGWVK